MNLPTTFDPVEYTREVENAARAAGWTVRHLSPLKAEELRDCADTSVDIACGLGQKGLCCRTFGRWNAVSLDRTEPD